jgi:NhaP-type Na+/H+ or K+/H+ antiporter
MGRQSFLLVIWAALAHAAASTANSGASIGSPSKREIVDDEFCSSLAVTTTSDDQVAEYSAALGALSEEWAFRTGSGPSKADWEYVFTRCLCNIWNYTYARDVYFTIGPMTPLWQWENSKDNSKGHWTFFCLPQCPIVSAPDFKGACHEGAHEFRATYRAHTKQHNTLQWEVLFVVFWVLVGAFFRRFSPSWVPYTVGVLAIGVILGAIAEKVEQDSNCPHNLFQYDKDHDYKVSRAEYDDFLCIGCNPDAFCPTAQDTGRWGLGRRTCGDGSKNAPGCPDHMNFTSLDRGWKKSLMHPETVDTSAGDGYLDADELWRSDCNFLRDMLSLSDMDPHYLLVIFLPALLFESATFGLDIGIFKRQKFQIIIMAFPAMIVASALTGLLLYAHSAVVQTGWTFWHCWLVGIISSATDPVAVVALLKDLGASKNLGTLIEGESLLNDGSAVVLFVWVRNVIGYDHSTIGPSWMFSVGNEEVPQDRYAGLIGVELLRVVLQMLCLGVLLGVAAGKLTCFMLRRVYEDALVELSLLLGVSYFVFWLAELVMGVSAVIVVVVMGLCVNMSKGSISPKSLHAIHSFYEMAAHFLNTIIFAIAGVKLGVILAGPQLFQVGDTFYWLVIYPIVLFARGAAIALFFPLLKRLGTKATWQEAVVMWWGGLRGSVGLALALALAHTTWSHDMWGGTEGNVTGGKEWAEVGDTGRFILPCHDVPANALVMTCIVVLTTVVINGMTMATLMRFLGLTATPECRQFAIGKAMITVAKKTKSLIEELKQDSIHSAVDWDTVGTVLLQDGSDAVQTTGNSVERAAWLHVLQMERASYLEQFESGIMRSASYNAVEEMMANFMASASSIKDTATQNADQEISYKYDQQLKLFLDSVSNLKANPVEACLGMDHPVSIAWGAAVAYKRAMRDVQHVIHHDTTYDTVLKEHEDNVLQVDTFLAKLQQEHPDLVKNLATAHAAKTVLRRQCATITHLQHEGALMDLDAAKLLHEPMVMLRKLEALPITQPLPPVKQGVGSGATLTDVVTTTKA